MPELDDLYQELILDHNKNPHNFYKLENADRSAEGFNPLCGDKVTIYMKLEGDVIKEISFQGSGCAISKASASLMTETLKNKTKAEAETFFTKFHQMVTGKQSLDESKNSKAKPGASTDSLNRQITGNGHFELGKLSAFSGVKDYPVRVKCATLAWHTFRAALESKKEQVTTE